MTIRALLLVAVASCTVAACSSASRPADLFGPEVGGDAGSGVGSPGAGPGGGPGTGTGGASSGTGGAPQPGTTTAGALPITGDPAPTLGAFDDAMLAFMTARHISAGALAVTHDGKIALSHGYGTLDGSAPLTADAPFRLAGISALVTAAAVRRLVAQGALDESARVIALLALDAAPGASVDPRIYDVTVKDLLEHRGGWDAESTQYDPEFDARGIAHALGLVAAPTKRDVARYMMGRPLDFDPGSRVAYSNFGFSLLGMVVEAVTGRSYGDSVSALLGTAGMQLATVGGTSLEPRYADGGRQCQSAIDPQSSAQVACPYGGFDIAEFDSFAGLVASAPALARFLDAYAITGAKGRPAAGTLYYFFGSLPGSYGFVYQVKDGTTSIAALFNQRSLPIGVDDAPLKALMDQAVGRVSSWP